MDKFAVASGSAERKFELGRSLLRDGRRTEAVAELIGLVEAYPNTPKYSETLIEALRDERRDREAIVLAERAVEWFPGHAGLWVQLALALADAGRYEAADTACLSAHKLDLYYLATSPFADFFEGALKPGDLPALIDAAAKTAEGQWTVCRVLGRFTAETLARQMEEAQGAALAPGERVWPFGRGRPESAGPPILPVAAGIVRPELSVMVPVYRPDPAWLRTCLESVLAQKGMPEGFEIVVVDDGADGAVRIQAESLPGVRYHGHGGRLGLVGNHNRCIAEARGQFIHILHQDDLVEPGLYAALLDPLRTNPTLAGAFSGVRLDPGTGPLLPEPLEKRDAGAASDLGVRLVRRQRIQFSSIMVRRTAYEAIGGFSPERAFAFDWEMWARLAGYGPLWYDPRPLAVTRLHTRSATHAIAPLDRLVDILRTQYGILRTIPGGGRRAAAARLAFTFQCADAWQTVVRATDAPDQVRTGALRDFLQAAAAGKAG